MEEAANENLKREGIVEKKIFRVGDVMVDCLLLNLDSFFISAFTYGYEPLFEITKI